MSYLDDPRVYFAAERTLLAWQRTSVALIGLGFVVERFGLYIRTIEGGSDQVHPGASLGFGVAFLVLGATVAIVSAVEFSRFVRVLTEQERPPRYPIWFAPTVNYVLAAAALAMAAWFVFTG